ncbi:Cytosol aminopeptidase PepA [hydrothermal vent metagenome]|uniref:leucyl aminopeptidase n=1 Tax=hydrothermal vent metagenome TaxID=652676 RepID=A0A3B1C543_9ZZZZ
MDISIKYGLPEQQKSACVILGIFERRKLSPAAEKMDQACGGDLQKILKSGDIEGKAEQSLMLHNVNGCACERILLIGCGKEKNFDDSAYRKALKTASAALLKSGARDAVNFLTELKLAEHSSGWKIRQAVEIIEYSRYRPDHLKSKKDSEPKLHKIVLAISDADELKSAKQGLAIGRAIAHGSALTRELGNLPGNICTPTYLAAQAAKLGKQSEQLKVRALGQKQMETLGMGALLSVAKGSRQPPKLIEMNYQGGKKTDKPIILVGKGITFDSGGISIKPSAAMDEMKYDMCGAASVIGAMAAISELQLPLNVIAVIPSCENLPDGAASKPGDIVTSMSGQTIEVLNTDAEGRLILCDALTYSEKFKPKAVIDVATLTGACVIALGKHACGLLSNDERLAQLLLDAGEDSGDRAWKMPLWNEYDEQLKSNFADMANIGGREAGTITAACFLARFSKNFKWAHLDIAGVAWEGGSNKGATGRPVALLTQYLLNQCGKNYQLS